MKKEVLGIKIDDITSDEALKIVEGWLKKPQKHYIVTPNPEFVVMAQQDQDFKKILNNADLSLPDGVGLRLSGDIVCNTPGIDFMESLIKFAADYGFTTGFLGGSDGVAEKASERLQKKYQKLKISFAQSGGQVDEAGNMSTSCNLPPTDLLFVAFGPPKQEKWIYNNLSKLDVKVAMGVGGSFDYLSGRIARSPRWIRNLGGEWLFRLVIQPWRIKRQLRLLKFIWQVMLKYK